MTPARPLEDTPRGDAAAQAPAAGFLLGLQVLRALAALAVVAHHTLEESLPLLTPDGKASDGFLHAATLVGASGVDLFFVISGFIMVQTNWSDFGTAGASGRFLWRRLLRIMPLYWLCVVLVVGAKYAGLYRSLELNPTVLAQSLLLLPAPHHVIGVTWTLVFEMYFYAVFAGWLWDRQRSRALVGVLGSLLLVGVLATALLPTGSWRMYLSDPIVAEFVLGMGVAWAYRAGVRPAHRGALRLTCVALIVAAAWWLPAVGTSGLQSSIRFWAWGIPAAVVVFTVLHPVGLPRAWAQPLVRLGNASYALYLSHALVMTAYARVLKNDHLAQLWPPACWMVLVFAASIAVGWLMHRYVELWLTQLIARRVPSVRHAGAPLPAPSAGAAARGYAGGPLPSSRPMPLRSMD